MTDSDHIDDLIAPYALGALEPDELEWVEAHLAACERCRLEAAEAKEVTSLLAYATPAQTPPARVRADLMRRLDTRIPAQPERLRRPSTSWWASWWRPVALAASLGLAVMLVGTASMLRQMEQMQQELHSEREQTRVLAPRATQEAQLMSMLITSEADTTPLRPASEQSAASGLLLTDYRQNKVVLMAHDLPALAPGTIYQVWFGYDNQPFSGGVFRVELDGSASLEMVMPDYMPLYRWVWVTVEPESGSATPTGTLTLTGTL
jgi:anti-sigma-K factor RskA